MGQHGIKSTHKEVVPLPPPPATILPEDGDYYPDLVLRRTYVQLLYPETMAEHVPGESHFRLKVDGESYVPLISPSWLTNKLLLLTFFFTYPEHPPPTLDYDGLDLNFKSISDKIAAAFVDYELDFIEEMKVKHV